MLDTPITQINQMLQEAITHHRMGNLDAAYLLYKKVLNSNPEQPDALTGLGTIALQQNKLLLAAELLSGSIKLVPRQSQALSNYGLVLSKLKQYDQALINFDKAIAINPHFSDAYNNRGLVLHSLGRFNEALLSFDKAIAINPNYSGAYVGKAAALDSIGSFEEALLSFDKAIAINPKYVAARFNRAALLQKLDRLDEALLAYDDVISIDPEFVEAYNNRGVVLKTLNRPEDAIADLDKAIAINPKHVLAYGNRGSLFQNLNRLDDALASYNKAIELNPEYADAYFTKAEVLLSKGDYLLGWDLYEWRWKSQFRNEKLPAPIWDGKADISGRVVLVLPEAGFGDFIMFARYIPLLCKMNAKVVVVVPKPLFSLFSDLSWDVQFIKVGDSVPDSDYVCPIMSFPRIFKTTLDNIPAEFPYLSAPVKSRNFWHKKLRNSKKFKIGLVWSGNLNRNIDKTLLKRRRMSLDLLEPLLQLPYEFHSLQKEVSTEDIASLVKYPNLVQHQNELVDFSDTAGLISELDLIISIDTSVAHLAGALGKPLWVMLPYSTDYRWTMGSDKTPWYPGANLYRQTEVSNWSMVINQICDQLRHEFPL